MSEILKQKQLETLLKWRTISPALFAFAVVSSLFLLTLLVITPTYDVNDDPAMALIVSGNGTLNGPDEHLLYSNVLIGKLLKQLYQSVPLFPWYGSYLLLAHFISYWVLLYVLLLRDRQFLGIIGFLIFYLVTGIYFLTHLQFTSTSFLLALSGMSLILTNLIQDAEGDPKSWLKWGGVLCLIVSSLIRLQAFQMFVLASLPLLLVLTYRYLRKIKIVSYVVAAALISIGVLGTSYYDHQFYQQDQDWQKFVEYHSELAQVTNYAQIPYTDQTKPMFDEVGWSLFDYWMLRKWIYLDRETYTFSQLNKFKERSDELSFRKIPQITGVRIGITVAAFTNPTFLFCCAASILLIWQMKDILWQRRTIIWMLIWTVSLMLWLVIYKKLPERVYIPLISYPYFIALFFAIPLFSQQQDTEIAISRSSLKWVFLVLFLGSCFMTWNQKQRSDLLVKYNQRFKHDLNYLNQHMPDKIFLTVASFPIERFLPLDTQTEIKDFKFLWLTGRQNSPLFLDKKNEYQIGSPYTDLYETDRLLLISHPDLDPILKGYFKQHYGVNLSLKTVYLGGRFLVCKAIVKDEEAVQSDSPAKLAPEKQ